MKVSLRKKLDEISKKHLEIEKLLSEKDVINDMDKYKNLSVEYAKLEIIIKDYKKYLSNEESLKDSEEIAKNETGELKKLADEEIRIAKEEISSLEKNLEISLLPEDPNDNSNVFLEIRAGTGGLEAAIFAGDLLRMYQLYSEKNKWGLNVISFNEGSSGGYKEIVCSVEGEDVYGKLKFEAGTHRVQRVPNTETQGRVHTSAATVAVLPEAEDVELEVNNADIRKDTYRASGAGGQHVNKTESAVRLTHEPTGVVVECQDGRSQHANYDKAMKVLRSKLYEIEVKKQNDEIAGKRKTMVGSGDRSDKIRTYNYPQGRVTDHRINHTVYNLPEVVSGGLFSFTEKLRIAENAEKMKVGLGG